MIKTLSVYTRSLCKGRFSAAQPGFFLRVALLNDGWHFFHKTVHSVFQKYSFTFLLFSVCLVCSSGPVTEASVHIVGSQPILNNSFTLTCRTTGTVESITWMHNWSPLYSDETRVLSMDNATLTFSSVMLSDNGNYSCMASNAVSNISSQWFMLDIFCEYLKDKF